MKIKICLLFFFLFITSCSSYINNAYRKLDESYGQTDTSPEYDKFSMFRHPKRIRREPSNFTSNDVNKMPPTIKRDYVQKQRYNTDDLRDNVNEGSLWFGGGQQNYLFSKNKNRKPGDIVIINVQGKLKKEISLELVRAFPVIKKPISKNKNQKDSKGPQNETANNAPKEDEKVNESKVYDHISGIITENLEKEHVLIKGRKDVLFKNRKRLIEVKGLIARRDINDQDEIDSSKLIESSITVLR